VHIAVVTGLTAPLRNFKPSLAFRNPIIYPPRPADSFWSFESTLRRESFLKCSSRPEVLTLTVVMCYIHDKVVAPFTMLHPGPGSYHEIPNHNGHVSPSILSLSLSLSHTYTKGHIANQGYRNSANRKIRILLMYTCIWNNN